MNHSSSASTLQGNQTDTFDFNSFKNHVASIVELDMKLLLDNANMHSPLYEASMYVVDGKGKRARPLLVACSYLSVLQKNKTQPSENANQELLKPAVDQLLWQQTLSDDCRRAMLAVELLHNYSLIHDDLPCMDNDALRRGRATCHIAFDEATALLAGDVLQTLAFEALSIDLPNFEPISAQQTQALLQVFAPRSRRMVIGQSLDLQAENTRVSQPQLEAIHRDKTGALIEAAVLMGGIIALHESTDTQTHSPNQTLKQLNISHQQQLSVLQEFSVNIGLAFQVQDDILDVTSSTAQLGKPAGSDEKLNKSTYVKLMGVDTAKNYAKTLFESALSVLIDEYGSDTALSTLANWLWHRQN